jgi:hypothetical protein
MIEDIPAPENIIVFTTAAFREVVYSKAFVTTRALQVIAVHLGVP